MKGAAEMQGYSMVSGWGGMWLGPAFMVLVPLVVIGLIIWMIRASAGGGESRTILNPTPQQILDERFARGDIDEDEYHRRRKALGQ